ncbi:hypothetical protein KP509_1Z003200 [Ceratopteris richardii]|nr:hypothetical protein KP509_1Z003200 [Ceratopteris richardii]
MNVAQQVFDKLLIQTEESWHSLIIGYVKFGDPASALVLFERMQMDPSYSISGRVSLALLKACSTLKDFISGNSLYVEIARTGLLERDIFMGSALVDMYAKCGLLNVAEQVFEKVSLKNVVTWNSLLTAYVNNGYGIETLIFFNKMHFEGVVPDPVTFVCGLKACASTKDRRKGQEIHSEIERRGILEMDYIVGGAVVDMYVKVGALIRANEVFDKLLIRDVVAWTSLLVGIAENRCNAEALACLEQMQLEGVFFDATALVCLLQACAGIRSIANGRHIHARIVALGLLDDNLAVGNALVDMYAKCGFISFAQRVFDKLLVRDIVSWNTLLCGYVAFEYGEETLKFFDQMQFERITPNVVTYIAVLKACGLLKAIDRGHEIHFEIQGKGLHHEDLIGNALIDMYVKCGLLGKAEEVFDNLSSRTEVSWTLLIAGYTEYGLGNDALMCFQRMVQEGASIDVAAFISSLKACGAIAAWEEAEQLHEEVKKQLWLEGDPAVGSAIVDMYLKCGMLSKAQDVFDTLLVRNACLWTTLIAGYMDHGQSGEALNCFEQMALEGTSPDNVTYICCLKACGSVGAARKGRELHAEVARRGLIDKDPAIGSVLVDMYAKCGSVSSSAQVFEKLPVQDVASWNSLISGHCQLGDCDKVIDLFHKMLQQNLMPDSVTFINVLSACKSIGLFQKSSTFLDIMNKDFGIIPSLEHHACMVDILCCTGHLNEAMETIKRIPGYLDLAIWQNILNACRNTGNVEFGREAFKYAVRADKEHAASYIMMSHIWLL